MKHRLFNSFFLIVFAACFVRSEHAASTNWLLRNARVHRGDGSKDVQMDLGIRDGKILLPVPADFKPDSVLDLGGKHIYPGLIACNSNLGLSEIEAVRATNDFIETGLMNPGSRSLIAYNTDSKIIPTVKSNGVLLVECAPQGGIISGTSSVLNTSGWNWEDACVLADAAMHINWPNEISNRSSDKESIQRLKETRANHVQLLKTYFDEAKAYVNRTKPDEINTHYEAARAVFSGKRSVMVHANMAGDMMDAVNFFEGYGIKPILVGAADAHLVLPFLKEKQIAVVLVKTHGLPFREDEDPNLVHRLPFLLESAGIRFALSVDGFWQIRTLSYQAGTASAFGLTKEQALRSITLSAAELLGIANTHGSIADGKYANLLITQGDLLDIKESKIERAFINGKQTGTVNWQDDLYKRFKDKYGY